MAGTSMSLKDFGIFSPLEESHPLVSDGAECWICHTRFARGMRVALMPVETEEEAGSLTVKAECVCATCRLRGEEVNTPTGRRIIERIKDGDGSPYPVILTNGNELRDDEVSPLT